MNGPHSFDHVRAFVNELSTVKVIIKRNIYFENKTNIQNTFNEESESEKRGTEKEFDERIPNSIATAVTHVEPRSHEKLSTFKSFFVQPFIMRI